MSSRVYLSLGSNIQPRHYLPLALGALESALGRLVVSPVYESEAVGFQGDNFLNLVVGADVDCGVGELSRLLRGIEDVYGRVRQSAKFSARTLDIDILTFGQLVGNYDGVELPRDEVVRYAYVIRPLADIDPEGRYPVDGRCYREISAAVAAGGQELWEVHW